MSGKPGKLVFKGDKPKKPKSSSGKSEKRKREDESETNLPSWISAEKSEDVMGPVVLATLAAANGVACICSFPDSTQVSLDNLPGQISQAEPSDVGQVWQTVRPDSNRPHIVSFKSPNGKYLGCDKFGLVMCEREAIGPSETFEMVWRDAGVGFKSTFDKFLSIDPQAQTKNLANVVRADSDSMGFKETFHVRMQSKFKANKKSKHETTNITALEQEKLKQFVHVNSRPTLSSSEKAQLSEAVTQGRLNEYFLEKRAQKKSDKYCK